MSDQDEQTEQTIVVSVGNAAGNIEATRKRLEAAKRHVATCQHGQEAQDDHHDQELDQRKAFLNLLHG